MPGYGEAGAHNGHSARLKQRLPFTRRVRRRIERAQDGDVSFERRTVWKAAVQV